MESTSAAQYRCIGGTRDGQRCSNTSPVPTRADRPEWGWLCPACSGEKPLHPVRTTLHGVTVDYAQA